MTKSASTSEKPRKQHTPEFRQGTLKLAERTGMANSACGLSLYESSLYTWQTKQRQQLASSERGNEFATENVLLKRQLAE